MSVKVVPILPVDYSNVLHVVKVASHRVALPIAIYVAVESIHCHHKDLVWFVKLDITVWPV